MSKTTPRGRPRKFDKAAVLQVIVNVFWAKGFAGTSLDDLSATTGLSRPSLYAAYGNKLSMYLAALEVFGHRMARDAVGALSTGSSLQEGLENFYEAALDIYLGENEALARGCLVFTTAVTEATTEPKVRQVVNAQLDGLDQALKSQIRNHLPDKDEAIIETAASLAAGTLLNLATRARAGTPRATLSEIAHTAIAAITQFVANHQN